MREREEESKSGRERGGERGRGRGTEKGRGRGGREVWRKEERYEGEKTGGMQRNDHCGSMTFLVIKVSS